MSSDVPEVLFSVGEVDDSRRNAHSRNNERCERTDCSENDDERKHTDDGADYGKVVVQYLYRSASGFTLGVLKPFVKLRQIKAGEVDFPCLVHYLKIYMVHHKLVRDIV